MAIKKNLFIDQGSTFSSNVTAYDSAGVALNLTGYTSRGMVKKWYSSNSSVSFNTSIPTPNTGIVNIALSANTTSAMSFGRYVYDVEIVDAGGAVTRIIEGILTLNPEVTQ